MAILYRCGGKRQAKISRYGSSAITQLWLKISDTDRFKISSANGYFTLNKATSNTSTGTVFLTVSDYTVEHEFNVQDLISTYSIDVNTYPYINIYFPNNTYATGIEIN